MVKVYEHRTLYPFPWTDVALGFFRRYPNPYSLHVLTVDVLQQELRDGKLYTKRLITKAHKGNLPKWSKRFFKKIPRKVSIIEESLIDPENGVIESFSRNIGFTTCIMYVAERNIFKRAVNEPESTLVHKAASIESSFYGFRRALEAFGIERFKKNSEQANKGYLYVLQRLSDRLKDPNEKQLIFTDSDQEEVNTLKPEYRVVSKVEPEIQKRFWRRALDFSWISSFLGSSKS
jgi:hypothetical protein